MSAHLAEMEARARRLVEEAILVQALRRICVALLDSDRTIAEEFTVHLIQPKHRQQIEDVLARADAIFGPLSR